MKRIITIFSILLTLLVVGLVVAPNFVDLNRYKAEISKKIEEASGYHVIMNGDISLSLLPAPAAKVEDVVVRANKEDEIPLLTLKRADVSVELMPLLQKSIAVKQVRLIEPNIYIAKKRDGSLSYISDKQAKAQAGENEVASSDTVQGNAQDHSLSLSFDHIKIENGSFEFTDAAKQTSQIVKDIDLNVRAKSLQGPFQAKGSLAYQDMAIKFSAETIEALDKSGAIPVKLQAELQDSGATLNFGGVIDTKTQEAQGEVAVAAQDVNKAMVALSSASGKAPISSFSMSGEILAGAKKAAITNAQIMVDAVKASGDVAVTGYGDKSPLQIKTKLRSSDISSKVPQAKVAAADLNITLEGKIIKLAQSHITLDNTKAVVAGSFTPNAKGRGKASVDVSAEMIDFDAFIKSKAATSATQQNVAQTTKNIEKSVESVKGLSLPFDVNFDISAQKAKLQQKTINGILLRGDINGNLLIFKEAGVNDYQGLSARIKGGVQDMSSLTGVDVDIDLSTKNAAQTMKNFALDTSKLPANIGAASLNVNAKGSTQALRFDASVKALGGNVSAKGNAHSPLNNPQLSGTELSLSHPNFVKAMQVIAPNFKGGQGLAQKISMKAKVDQDGKTYKLSNIAGSYGGMAINGAVAANMAGAKPKITGDLSLGNVPLDTFLGSEKAAAARKSKSSDGSSAGQAGSKKQRWSARTIDVGWINTADVDFDVSAKSVNYGGWSFSNPKAKIDMSAGRLAIQNLNAGIFGGQARVDGHIAPRSGGGLDITGKSSMENASLEALAYALSNSNRFKAQGNASLVMDIASGGTSANALVNALGGSASLNGQDIVMEGFDLAKLARSLSADIKPGDSVQGLMAGVRGGTTQIDTLAGQYDIQNGVVGITSMSMDGPAANIASRGNVSLPKWTIDTVHTISLKDASDDVPSFDVAIKGALDNPGNTFGQGIVRDFLQRKIERKLAKEAEKFLGDKVDGELGNALKKLGILGGGSNQNAAPQGQQAPANDNTAPVQQQQPAQEPQTSPEEELIRGVLDLF